MQNKKKFDRKAWLRILEAFIAIMIIISAVLVIISRQGQKTDISDNVYEKQRQILDIISKNDSLRADVLNNQKTNINNAIVKMVSATWDFAVEICNLDAICNSELTPHDKEVYVSEVVITSNLTMYNPKKLKLFVWMK